MHVSVNTAVFLNEIQNGKSQLECLKQLVKFPIDNIEVRGELFNKDTQDKELTEIDSLCKNNNWKFFFSIPEQLFNDDQINSNLEEYLNLAAKHHISQLKISMGNSKDISSDQLNDLTSLLNKYNVKVTIENQPNPDGILNTFIQQLNKLNSANVPLGYTFDSGNWYWINENPNDSFKKLLPNITVFHLKDIQDEQTVMLGKGATDWKPMLKDLNKQVPVFLEYDIPKEKLNEQIKEVNDVLKDRENS